MKLSTLRIRDRIDQLSVVMFRSDLWDLSLEAGIVTIRPTDPNRADELPYCVPMSNVVFYRPSVDAGAKPKATR